jgi:hypothetical protein
MVRGSDAAETSSTLIGPSAYCRLDCRCVPREWAWRRGSAIERSVQLADAAGIAGLLAGLAAVGLV